MRIHSSNMEFKELEVNVDTVYVRSNPEKWIDEDVHVGWIYDEVQYNKDSFIELITKKNEALELELIETNMEMLGIVSTVVSQNEIEQAEMLMDIMDMISQLQVGGGE